MSASGDACSAVASVHCVASHASQKPTCSRALLTTVRLPEHSMNSFEQLRAKQAVPR